MVKNVKVIDILKAIQKLNPAEKHRLGEYLIDKLTASSSTGSEISERKDKSSYRCPDCESEHIVRLGSIQLSSKVKKLKNNVIVAKLVC